MTKPKRADPKPDIEETYPGITEQIRGFDEATLPACPHCGSNRTAKVQVGFVPRLANIAAATAKVKIVLNMQDKGGNYYCRACEKFFD